MVWGGVGGFGMRGSVSGIPCFITVQTVADSSYGPVTAVSNLPSDRRNSFDCFYADHIADPVAHQPSELDHESRLCYTLNRQLPTSCPAFVAILPLSAKEKLPS